MYVACSTMSFADRPFDQALQTIQELQFPKIDVGLHEQGPHLKPSDVARDPARVAQQLRLKAGGSICVAAFHVDFGPVVGSELFERLRAVCRLARMLTVPLVCVAASPAGTDLETEAIRLAELVRVTDREGVLLTVETHSETVTGDPKTAVELCRRVRGLGLTLDPSHYLIGPHRDNFDEVYPYVQHVRLRDTSTNPPRLQVRVGQGHLDYSRMVAQLSRHHYQRGLCVDIQPAPDQGFPVVSEVRKLKYLLESLN